MPQTEANCLTTTDNKARQEKERVFEDANGNTTMAEYAAEIHIGNNVWIACNAVVLSGVHIGNNAVIGAGSAS